MIRGLILTALTIGYISGYSERGIKSTEHKAPLNFKSDVLFTENKGQIVDQNYKPRADVLFGGQTKGLVYHLKENGISYQLSRVDSWKMVEDQKMKENRRVADQLTIYRVDINWLKVNKSVKVLRGKVSAGYSNFYTEGCPEGGALEVRSYGEITYKSIYEGIDLKWYEKDGELKYDYICSAGSNYKQIELEIEGAKEIRINETGELEIETPLGKIVEQSPVVFQGGMELRSKWLKRGDRISFEIDGLDKSKPYIIDPAIRTWGTYYGGGGEDNSYSCPSDALGNVYTTGYTSSSTGTIIATTGSHQLTFGGSSYDAYLVKFNSSGVRQWGTYYGGADNDYSFSSCIDNNGNIYIAGTTNPLTTNSVIATIGSHQINNSGSDDGFFVKFNSSGVRIWGTFYGGSGIDQLTSCSTDGSNYVYVAGRTSTSSGTNIATNGCHQVNYGGGAADAFVAKFDLNGIRQWGTYYGGLEMEHAYSCSVDFSGNIILSGVTSSTLVNSAISTINAHQVNYGGGLTDVFLVKFTSGGIRLWGTYYGGNSSESEPSCSYDSNGNIYLSGRTRSNNGNSISTLGSHQSAFGGGTNDDAFLVKFNSTGVRQWGTYYGGVGPDEGKYTFIDILDNVYLVGVTGGSTGTIIATPGAHQVNIAGASDSFLVKFNSNGVRQWGTFYGGLNGDTGYSGSIDNNGVIHLTGITSSSGGTVIATNGSHQQAFAGGINDAFLVQFNECLVANPTNTTPQNNLAICSGTVASISAISGTNSINWFSTPTSTTVLGTGTVYNTPVLTTGTYTFYAEASGCMLSPARTPITVTVNPTPTIAVVSSSSVLCLGQTASLTASGASSYTWAPGGVGSQIVVSPTVNTNYTVTGTDMNGCQNNSVYTLSVTTCTGLLSIDNLRNGEVVIYPNPTKSTIKISGILPFAKIEVFNCIGQLILQVNSNDTNIELNLENMYPGIYFIRIGTKKYKVVKE